MIEVTKQYIIERPLNEVYQFISKTENDIKWLSSCLEVNKLSENSYGVIFKFFGKKINFVIVTNSEVDKAHHYETTSGPLFFKGIYQFEEHDQATKVTWKFAAEPNTFFGLVPHGILRKALDKQSDGDIKTLKQILHAESLVVE